MKIYCFNIIIFFSVILAQFSTNNINGFGSDMYITSTSSESMGGMWMNNSNINNWDPLLASSLYNSNLTMIAISSSLEGIKSNIYNTNSHHINFINFSFPFRKTMGVAMGFSPYSKADYTFLENPVMIPGTEFSAPLSSNNSYIIKGGISKLSLALSKGFFLNNIVLSTGFKWNILFGNQKVNRTTNLNEVSYDQDGNESLTLIETLYSDKFNHFKAHLYEFDSRITIKRNNFSFLITAMDNFEVENSKVDQLFSDSTNYFFNKIQLDQFGVGYMYKNNNNFGVAVEGHFKKSIQYPNEIMLLNSMSPSKISFHNGFYKIINNPKSDSWNSINFRVGYSYKIIKFINKDLNDISFSFGAGISFNNFKNDIDISFTIGLSENIVETIDADNYYKLNVGILSGDQWFKKRRRR